MVLPMESSLRLYAAQGRPWDEPGLDPWSKYLIKNLLKKKKHIHTDINIDTLNKTCKVIVIC